MTSHRKALEALIADVDAITEDLVDPMAHTHTESTTEALDCLGCIMLARLSSAAEGARKALTDIDAATFRVWDERDEARVEGGS